MNVRRLSLGAIGAGLSLVALSWLWPALVPQRLLWDEQRAANFAAASVDLHEAIHADEHDHKHGHTFSRDHHDHHEHSHREGIEEAQARYAAARAQLERAHTIRDGVPRYLQWAGVVLGGLGALGFFTRHEQ